MRKGGMQPSKIWLGRVWWNKNSPKYEHAGGRKANFEKKDMWGTGMKSYNIAGTRVGVGK